MTLPVTLRLATLAPLVFLKVKVEVPALERSKAKAAAVRWRVVVLEPNWRVPFAASSVSPVAAAEARVTAPEPVLRFEGLRLVRLAPEMAGRAPVRLPAVRLVRLAPDRAGRAPPAVVCTSCEEPLKVLPSFVMLASLDRALEEIWVPPIEKILPVPASTLPAQAKLPEALVTVQPVEPAPPPSRMSPVEVAPMETVPAPVPSMVRLPVPWTEVPEMVRPLTAPEVMVPEPALMLPPEVVMPPGMLAARPVRPSVRAVVVAAVPMVRVVVVVPASTLPVKRLAQMVPAAPRSLELSALATSD